MYVGDSSIIRINIINESFCEYRYSIGCLVHVNYNCQISRENDSVIVLKCPGVHDSLFIDRWEWKNNILISLTKYHITLRPERPRCDTSRIYETVDVMPVYPGGEEEIGKFILSNFKYTYPDDGDFQMTFLTEFIIDRMGRVTNVRMLNRLSDAGKEMLRVIRSMPAWKPGSCEGINVPVRMSMPIRF